MRLVLALLVAGCHSGLRDPAYPTGSTTIVSQGRSMYMVNAWDGTLVKVDASRNLHEELAVDGEPTRVARVGEDEVWVTLRAQRQVVIYGVRDDAAPVELDRMTVGAEPYGIVASEDGSRVYIALSQEDAVVEVDAPRREVVERWEVNNEPRWLALHPTGRALFVIYGFDATVTRIDLRTGEMRDIEPPETRMPQDDGSEVPMNGRPTGDPTISPIGDVLIVPTLYTDNESAGEQPSVVGEAIQTPPVPYYTSANSAFGLQLTVSRFNPALIGIPLDAKTGEPIEGEDSLPFFVGGFDGGSNVVRGYISSATFQPDSSIVYASMESADAVAIIDLSPVDGQGMKKSMSSGGTFSTFGTFAGSTTGSTPIFPPADGWFYERAQVIMNVGNNPSGLAVGADGKIWVHERGSREVSWFKGSSYNNEMVDARESVGFFQPLRPIGRQQAGRSHLPQDVEIGRQMFYSATDGRMAAAGAGVSCSTCHFDGRNDGLTWTFDNNPRQTPSLAGPVGETAPVTWSLDVESVAMEAMITSAGRMGGGGLSHNEATRIEAFINFGRDVDTQHKGRRDDLVARGAELFHSEEVGCAECHNGPRMTDNGFHTMFGLENVNTPTLVGIDASPPYLHDGSAPTLRAVVERARNGEMGDTSGLSDNDIDALVAYLKSL